MRKQTKNPTPLNPMYLKWVSVKIKISLRKQTEYPIHIHTQLSSILAFFFLRQPWTSLGDFTDFKCIKYIDLQRVLASGCLQPVMLLERKCFCLCLQKKQNEKHYQSFKSPWELERPGGNRLIAAVLQLVGKNTKSCLVKSSNDSFQHLRKLEIAYILEKSFVQKKIHGHNIPSHNDQHCFGEDASLVLSLLKHCVHLP